MAGIKPLRSRAPNKPILFDHRSILFTSKMPRIDEKTKVRCTCGQSFCRVMVSVRTRQNHERDIAAAEEDSSENGDNEDEEMGVASGDVNDSSDDGMDGGPQAISNPIEAQGAGNEDMIWDALYDEEEGPVGTINAIRVSNRLFLRGYSHILSGYSLPIDTKMKILRNHLMIKKMDDI